MKTSGGVVVVRAEERGATAENHIRKRLAEAGLLRRRWPEAKGEHRAVALGAGGGRDLPNLSPETVGGVRRA